MNPSLSGGASKPAAIHAGTSVFERLKEYLERVASRNEKAYILADENTKRFCLPVVLAVLPGLHSAEVLEIRAGENKKNLETARMIWDFLEEKGAGRHSVLINIGGGVVTDLGGFAASTFMRGIPFLHVPTTLIGMADAAIGGKTGVNLGTVKNQLGTFHNPEAIFIHTGFLKTLDDTHILGGLAEILKMALVADSHLWDRFRLITFPDLLKTDYDDPVWQDLVITSVALKSRIVEQDFRDENIRAILNFGHTLGHAFESLSLQDDRKPLSHGHAVAMGMICESCLSSMKTGLTDNDLQAIVRMILSGFDYYPLSDDDVHFLFTSIGHDKKRSGGDSRFSLLKFPGEAIPGVTCTPEEILDSIRFYRKFER
jgi:3-dehydroquinate synthase